MLMRQTRHDLILRYRNSFLNRLMMSKPGVRSLFVLTAVLIFAFVLRLIGLSSGAVPDTFNHTLAPFTHPSAPVHPDEYFYVSTPIQMQAYDRLNPRFFENPSMLIYLNLLTNRISGFEAPSPEVLAQIDGRSYAMFNQFFAGRVYSILGGLLAVAGAMALARTLMNRRAAFMAGVLTAVALPLVQHSHYTTTSSLASGFGIISLWAALLAMRQPDKWRFWLISGAFIGLATGNRYNVALLSLVLFLAGLTALYQRRDLPTLRRVLAGYALFPLALIATTPFMVLDFGTFWQQFSYIYGRYTQDVSLVTDLPAWALAWRYMLLFGLGGIGFIGVFFLIGAVLKRRRSHLPKLVLPLVLSLVVYTWIVLQNQRPGISDQLTVPIIPLLTALAGAGFAWASPRWGRLSWMLFALSICVPLLTSLQWLARMSSEDTRLIMSTWVYDNIPPQTRITLLGAYNTPLDSSDYALSQVFSFASLDAEELRQRADVLIVSDAVLFFQARLMGRTLDAVWSEHLTALNEFTRLHTIERPLRWLDDVPLNNASYWHHPGLTLYCLRPDSCEEWFD